MTVPQPAQPIQQVPPGDRSNRWILVVIVAVGVLAIGFGVAAGLGSFSSHSTSPATFTLSGTIDLQESAYEPFYRDGLGGCSGTGGYSDMVPGTAVLVADSTGHTIATGSLGGGRLQGDSDCVLPITVTGVPSNLQQYSVTVSHRGTQVISSSEAHSGLDLTLGN